MCAHISPSRVVFSEAPTEDALLWRLVGICYHCKVIPSPRKRLLNIYKKDLVECI